MSSQCFARLLLLVLLFRILRGDEFCATDGDDPPPITDPNYMCNPTNFSQIGAPPIQNSSHAKYCDVVFLLDLDSTFTSEENYTQIIQFISDATTTCMNRGVGYAVFAYPMFNDSFETVCCSVSQCKTSFGFMNYRNYVGKYDSLEPIQPVTAQNNFSYTLIFDLKRIAKPDTACLYNNYVLITNRLFNISDEIVISVLLASREILGAGFMKLENDRLINFVFSVRSAANSLPSHSGGRVHVGDEKVWPMLCSDFSASHSTCMHSWSEFAAFYTEYMTAVIDAEKQTSSFPENAIFLFHES
uniref:Uncharacterized protein n=1 Tax=Caenorhabditis japonica TaxID=281687 RepID=A0A8R1I0G8_CAEJA